MYNVMSSSDTFQNYEINCVIKWFKSILTAKLVWKKSSLFLWSPFGQILDKWRKIQLVNPENPDSKTFLAAANGTSFFNDNRLFPINLDDGNVDLISWTTICIITCLRKFSEIVWISLESTVTTTITQIYLTKKDTGVTVNK